MVEAIKCISETNAVSGNECLLRKYIIDNINADSVEVDSIGNIIALKKGCTNSTVKKAIITHIDECGMIVTDITDDGYVKFDIVGSVELRSIISKQVIINNATKGVIGMKAIHLQKKEERENVKKPQELYIDIGAKNKEEAKKLVAKGDYIAFTTKCADLNDNFKGKALSRIGVYVLMNAIKQSPKCDTYYVFTTQKEVGMRGAMIAVNKLRPDYVYILDSVCATDAYGVSEDKNCIKIGKGPVISYSDRNTISNRDITNNIINIAKDTNIAIQLVAGVCEKSDEGEIMLSNNGIKASNIKIPVRYLNTPVQICSKNDIEFAKKILELIISEEEKSL